MSITDKTSLQTAVDLWISENSSAISTYGQINDWDVSLVTDMSELFMNKTTFNDNINNWDVSNVTDMSNMFNMANSFNQNINQWNTSKVTDMKLMFYTALNFNQDINTQVVTVNGNIYTAWDVSSVTNMAFMFSDSCFNQAINYWDTSNVVLMNGMFAITLTDSTKPTSAFNQSINTASVTVGSNTYTAWNVSSVTNISGMFSGAFDFNQSLSDWDVSNVGNMYAVFMGATIFNQPLNDWNTSTAFNMESMFEEASAFNQPLNDWNTGNVVTMVKMFKNASVFNQSIETWNTSKVASMEQMFRGASAFNESINTNSTTGTYTTTGTNSYTLTINKNNGSVLNLHEIKVLDSNSINLIDSTTATATMDSELSGYPATHLIDGNDSTLAHNNTSGPSSATVNFSTSGVPHQVQIVNRGENLQSRFNNALVTLVNNTTGENLLNQHDVGTLTNATEATTVSIDIIITTVNWDVSAVLNMEGMFMNANSFNKPLNNWDVSNVVTMNNMFDMYEPYGV